ncbi:MAG: ribosomal L7Ae/L30e/S12e/Gadd45 family protein, partial [Thermoanaerobacteraceae bacterium]|nr:ribosomal L7Ae/L30e/S12e/Gadd45 family protein [Thermoanaerobacteraceae bacterium]
MVSKVYNYIGLMYKANKIKIGFKEFKSLNAARKVYLVLYASDASERVKNSIKYWCSLNNILYQEFGTKYELG